MDTGKCRPRGWRRVEGPHTRQGARSGSVPSLSVLWSPGERAAEAWWRPGSAQQPWHSPGTEGTGRRTPCNPPETDKRHRDSQDHLARWRKQLWTPCLMCICSARGPRGWHVRPGQSPPESWQRAERWPSTADGSGCKPWQECRGPPRWTGCPGSWWVRRLWDWSVDGWRCVLRPPPRAPAPWWCG